ncbi:MAG: SDR family oxidoreductase [Microcoleaceae cyanobacterium MO_207.B10]|nr:SDR family oxidoreductase [Microcoleaceae cyanobacterium MO_207.B10]
MTKIQKKVIWITGASSGIGEALAHQILAKDGKVILSARRTNKLERVKQNCQGNNPENIKIVPIDLSQVDSLETATQAALKCFGKVDILVNNAGISQRSLAVETTMAANRKIFEVNFFGAVNLTQLILPEMLHRKSGHLVVISSLVGKFGTPLRSCYAASKHALHGYFDSLRTEVAKDNIKVTLICPGYIQTEVSVNALTGDGSKYQKMDETQKSGIPVNICASRIVKAIEQEKQELYIARQEIVGVYLKKLFPTLLSKFLQLQ